jgi:hypothetical protein
MTNGVSVLTRCSGAMCPASKINIGRTNEIRGSSAAQKAHASPHLNGKAAITTSTTDKDAIARAPANKCRPARVFVSGCVGKIAHEARVAMA